MTFSGPFLSETFLEGKDAVVENPVTNQHNRKICLGPAVSKYSK